MRSMTTVTDPESPDGLNSEDLVGCEMRNFDAQSRKSILAVLGGPQVSQGAGLDSPWQAEGRGGSPNPGHPPGVGNLDTTPSGGRCLLLWWKLCQCRDQNSRVGNLWRRLTHGEDGRTRHVWGSGPGRKGGAAMHRERHTTRGGFCWTHSGALPRVGTVLGCHAQALKSNHLGELHI